MNLNVCWARLPSPTLTFKSDIIGLHRCTRSPHNKNLLAGLKPETPADKNC